MEENSAKDYQTEPTVTQEEEETPNGDEQQPEEGEAQEKETAENVQGSGTPANDVTEHDSRVEGDSGGGGGGGQSGNPVVQEGSSNRQDRTDEEYTQVDDSQNDEGIGTNDNNETENVPKTDVENNVLPNSDVPNNTKPANDVPNTDVPNNDVPNNDVSNNGVPNTDVSNNDVPNTDVPNNDLPSTDVPNNDLPISVDNEASADDTMPNKNVPKSNAAETDESNVQLSVDSAQNVDVSTAVAVVPSEETSANYNIQQGSVDAQKSSMQDKTGEQVPTQDDDSSTRTQQQPDSKSYSSGDTKPDVANMEAAVGNRSQFYPDIDLKKSRIPSDTGSADQLFIQQGDGDEERTMIRTREGASRGRGETRERGSKETGAELENKTHDSRDKTETRRRVNETNEARGVPEDSRGTEDTSTEQDGARSRAGDGEAGEEVFSTQVDEDVLEAARERTKAQWESRPSTSRMGMKELVESKAAYHFHEGIRHLSEENYTLAIQSLTKTLNLNPDQMEVYIHRAEAYLQLADFQSAILNYKRACIIQPDNFKNYSRLAFIYYLQGQCLFDQKLYPEALEAFSRAAEMRPEVIGYHTRSIACLAALHRHGECLALVNQRLETEHHNADLYVMRARLHQLFRNTTLCYYDVKDALNLDPDHPEAASLMSDLEKYAHEQRQQATLLSLQQRPRDALQKISLAIDTNPSVAEYHVLRGALHRRVNDFNAAIDDYLLALDKTDHDEESGVYKEAQKQLLLTYNDFAIECFNKDFYEEAILLLNKAIKGEKNEKGLYINRGDCFFKQAEFQFALADYHQALEIDTTDSSIKNRIAIVHNEYGVQEYQDKRYKEAESRFTLAIQNNPRQAQYYVSRSRVRQLMEDHSGARNDVLLALHLDPSIPEIVTLISRLFPGKSMRDVINSRMAATIRSQLHHLVPTASPLVLDPIQTDDSSEKASASDDTPEVDEKKVTIQEPSDTPAHPPPTHTAETHPANAAEQHPDKIAAQERRFNIAVVNEKKLIVAKVKHALHNRESLKHMGGRVTRMPDPEPPKNKKVNKSRKSTGWRRFTSGIGLDAITDKTLTMSSS